MKKITALILTVVMIFSLMSVTTLATTGAYTVTVAPVTNGTVTVDKTSANLNDPVTITVAPEAGYAVKTAAAVATAAKVVKNILKWF